MRTSLLWLEMVHNQTERGTGKVGRGEAEEGRGIGLMGGQKFINRRGVREKRER